MATDQQRLADPARQGLRAVPQFDPGQDRVPQGRLRGGHPPRRPRLRVRGLGREHLHGARRQHRHAAADRGDPRRHQPQVVHADRARPGLRARRAQPRARRALPGRRAVHDRHRGQLVPVREVDDHAVGTGEPGEITRAIQSAFEDALHGRTERYREWLDPVPDPGGWTPTASFRPRGRMPRGAFLSRLDRVRHPALRRHAARRHAGPRPHAVGRREGARRAQARRAGRPSHRGGLPVVEPQGARALRAAGPGALRARRHRRLRDDAPARCGGGRGRRPARARRLLRAGVHDRRQDVGPAPREGRARRPRREPGHDRRVGGLPGAGGQAGGLRRRALLRRLPRRPRLRVGLPARGGRRGRRDGRPLRHQRLVAAASGGRGDRRGARRRGRSGARRASTATTTRSAAWPTRWPPSRSVRARSRAR